MNQLKKLLALFIAVAALFTLAPSAAFATDEIPTDLKTDLVGELEPEKTDDITDDIDLADDGENNIGGETDDTTDVSNITAPNTEIVAATFSADTMGFMPMVFTAPNLDLVADFSDALMSGSSVVYLTDAFAADMLLNGTASFNGTLNNDVTIDGSKLSGALESYPLQDHFSVANAGTGTITFANITLEGNSGGGGGINLNAAAIKSKVVLRDLVFKNNSGALSVGFTIAEIDNCLFENNTAGIGGAIYAGYGATILAKNTSFIGNTATSQGYYGGAIGANTSGDLDLTFDSCYFKENKFTVTVGDNGRGGAIGLHLSTGKLTINNCYFEGNATLNKEGSGDGGAVSVFMSPFHTAYEMTVNISNSTFYNNAAGDDAGAVFFEGRNVANHKINISNSTFVGNTSGGTSGSDGGAAVQISGWATANVTYNTFYANTHAKGGGALGDFPIYTFITSPPYILTEAPTVIVQNNLFVENSGSGNYQNVKFTSSATVTNTSNVGYDNGTALNPAVTGSTAFGTATPALSECSIGVTTGCSLSSGAYQKELTSIIIVPKGAAEAKSSAYAAVTTDVRGYTRDAATPDAGAVEIFYALFNAVENDGTWSGKAAGWNTGYTYYAPDATDATGYYGMGAQGGKVVGSVPAPTHATLSFLGWDLNKDATTATYTTATAVPADGQTYYAIFGEAQRPVNYTVNYNYNYTGNPGEPYYSESVEDGELTTAPINPVRTGYEFTGWYIDPECTALYDFTTPVESDLELYAGWKAQPLKPVDQVTVYFHYNYDGSPSDYFLTVNVNVGAAVANPSANPTRGGYTFGGWYTSAACTTKYDFSAAVNGELHLYASWSAVATPTAPAAPATPNTGDAARGPIYLAAAVLSAAFVAVFLIGRKKREQQ